MLGWASFLDSVGLGLGFSGCFSLTGSGFEGVGSLVSGLDGAVSVFSSFFSGAGSSLGFSAASPPEPGSSFMMAWPTVTVSSSLTSSSLMVPDSGALTATSI